jgi:hypothetical protein
MLILLTVLALVVWPMYYLAKGALLDSSYLVFHAMFEAEEVDIVLLKGGFMVHTMMEA